MIKLKKTLTPLLLMTALLFFAWQQVQIVYGSFTRVYNFSRGLPISVNYFAQTYWIFPVLIIFAYKFNFVENALKDTGLYRIIRYPTRSRYFLRVLIGRWGTVGLLWLWQQICFIVIWFCTNRLALDFLKVYLIKNWRVMLVGLLTMLALTTLQFVLQPKFGGMIAYFSLSVYILVVLSVDCAKLPLLGQLLALPTGLMNVRIEMLMVPMMLMCLVVMAIAWAAFVIISRHLDIK